MDDRKFEPARFVQEGQEVWVRAKSGALVLGKVVTAMGNTARVKFELRNVDTWFDVHELMLEVPRG